MQLYVHQRTASVIRPIKQLKGFERVTLKPGERRTVRLTLGPDAFALWNGAMKEVVEPGVYGIMAGANSRDVQSLVLEIV